MSLAGSVLEVEVIRSAKRRKTIEARLVDGVLRVQLPGWMSAEDEAKAVDKMRRRFERAAVAQRIDLMTRAERLADRHELPRPTSITWAEQHTLWGTCTPSTGALRISSRLAAWPDWVLDYVIVHELAHLVEMNHNARFHALEARYPKAERAIGFLIAQGWNFI
jgi:predicted metal-dependent hydrolase